jgi:hypothetical protein
MLIATHQKQLRRNFVVHKGALLTAIVTDRHCQEVTILVGERVFRARLSWLLSWTREIK